uniref:Gastric triacylglycerol lipase n=1 Tax=Schistocephalus solidus TaxID=70667 RepID=A0A0X3NPH9_SCHSO
MQVAKNFGSFPGMTWHKKIFPQQLNFCLTKQAKKSFFILVTHRLVGCSILYTLLYFCYKGTEIAFAKLNSDPVFRSKVAAMVALAPVVYLANVKSPLRLMSAVCKKMKFVNTLFGILPGGLLSLFPIVRFFSLLICHERSFPFLCSWILSVFVGFDPDNTNMTRLPVSFAHSPASTSVRNMVHYCQSMSHGKFQAFDFGKEGNMFHYYQPVPPVYGLGNIDIPLKLYWGGDDTLSTPSDVRSLIDELPKRSYIRNMYLPYYNHLEFVWGLDAAEFIYPDILDFLREFQ